jgi:hypothetical protein
MNIGSALTILTEQDRFRVRRPVRIVRADDAALPAAPSTELAPLVQSMEIFGAWPVQSHAPSMQFVSQVGSGGAVTSIEYANVSGVQGCFIYPSAWPIEASDLAFFLEGISGSPFFRCAHGLSFQATGIHAFEELDSTLSSQAAREADRALQQLSGELGRTVSNRLHELIALAQEEDSPGSLPSPQSFRALVDFLDQNRTFLKPGITLDDEGIVWAEWRRSGDCLATLRFQADGTIRWVMATPAPLRSSGRVTWRGDGGAEEVRAAIDARPALSWISRRSAVAA